MLELKLNSKMRLGVRKNKREGKNPKSLNDLEKTRKIDPKTPQERKSMLPILMAKKLSLQKRKRNGQKQRGRRIPTDSDFY
jgi:hypothetical protein